ncbi:Eco57I restriction-modification methylase domain-containing protein [Thermocrinis minervae]|uniref:site-specific DNA-methyltransferase (adenine-specific) n=1 Tax=Thermocrinis minervae TaxID=381751 RepID=A0A1M6RUS2_9AQUI|nr:Eco57I restriction-modification methylase domain-containing protein [Thermocrinis minervae]SHK36233.1 TaqI-like C-terminal specificity domain-containing protein [Thermocrinis minervae]
MDKEQAKKIVRETFEKPFDRDRYVRFLKNLLKSFEDKPFVYQGNYIPDPFKQYIKSLERIGKYVNYDKEQEKEEKIDLLIVTLKKETSLERARTVQRNFVAWYLKGSRGGEFKDAALVAFVSPNSEDWRFSLVKLDYRFEGTKVKEELTPAKRFSFLVGKNEKSHTAQSRFVPLLEKDTLITLKDLEEAFSVERVTEEFFEKYRDLFIRTKEKLEELKEKDPRVKQEFESKNIDTVDFAKKLLGQITFLYFLQKKGWFGVKKGEDWGTGPKDFIRRLFNREYGDYDNFFNDILEPLFYEALRTDRSADDHYYSRFNCRIPFLNGGLFDPINNYDWVNVDILLPNELFSNKNKTKEGDIGDGILDVFDRYNFTVNEEEPLDKEVALDPELLGKIYEKLNAIRSDNFDEYVKVLKSGKKGDETKFNKEYGVYYTPREIVHYMCQQSLVYYLESELSSRLPNKPENLRDEIEKFVKMADSIQEIEQTAIEKQDLIEKGQIKSTKYESQIPQVIRDNAELIDDLLANVKVCDPAVGSGAFPIGMLHEIVKLRQLLSVYTGKEIKTYDLKRHCIENSLYGVDIDPGAVEVCKLRFWLSLIVDEEDFHTIKPLPNLDYKVVVGNSLLGIEKNLFNSKDLLELEHLKRQYFNETHPIKKRELREEIDGLIHKITNGHKEFDFKVYFSEVFHEENGKKGFDIVIGNPPYVRHKRIKELKPLLQKAKYKIYDSTADLYTYFYEKGLEILKPNGILCFITSNKWMRAKYGEKLRKFLKQETEVLKIIDFSGYRVFEQTVDTNIILVRKKASPGTPTGMVEFVNVRSLPPGEDVISYIENNYNFIPQEKLDDKCWTLEDEEVLRLKEKIERVGKPLKEWDVKIYIGIVTGYNEAFIIDTETRNRILANCRTEEERKRTEEIIKPVLRGRDIGKYYYKWAGLWVIFIPWHFPLHDDSSIQGASIRAEQEFKKQYPSIYNHLLQFKDTLLKRKKEETGIRYEWYALQRCAATYYPEFEKEKIVWQHVSGRYNFAYIPPGLYLTNALFMITGETSILKYLIGILNSKFADYLLLLFTNLSTLGKYAYGAKDKIEQLPIPPITPQNQHIVKQIENLVDQILSITQSEDYLENSQKQEKVNEYQRQIDQLVYKLYGLTEDEIRIVERYFGQSRE